MGEETQEYDDLRPAGLLESWHLSRSALGLDTCVLVGATISSTTSSSLTLALTRSDLNRALADVLRKKENGWMYVVGPAAEELEVLKQERKEGKEGRLVLRRLRRVDLSKAIRVVDDDDDDAGDVQHALQATLRETFDLSGSGVPCWRLVFFSKLNLIVFAWHHGIGDGLTGRQALLDIIEALNSPNPISDIADGSVDDITIVKAPEDASILPAVEDLIDVSYSFRTLLPILSGLVVPSSWTLRDVWSGNPVPASRSHSSLLSPHNCRLRLFSLPPPLARSLLQKGKKHGASLTGTIHSVSLVVLSRLIASLEDGKRYRRIVTNVTISLRPFCSQPSSSSSSRGQERDDLMRGDLASSYQSPQSLLTSTYASSPIFDWSDAAAYTKELHDALPRTKEKIALMRLLKGDFEGYFKGKMGKKNGQTLEISNLGAVALSPARIDDGRTKYEIEDIFFGQSNEFIGSALKLNVSGAPSGGLCITLTWGAESVEDKFAEAFINGVEGELRRLAEMDSRD